MKKSYTLDQLSEVALEVIAKAEHKVLLFYGEMGVGKTTLIKEIFKQLKVEDNVSSPTFSLVNEYHTSENDIVYHFDFYRIDNEEEALDMGVEEYFYSNRWCLVEWPNKIENLLPLESVKITISADQSQLRTIQLEN